MTGKSEATLQPAPPNPAPTSPVKFSKRLKHLAEYAGVLLLAAGLRLLPRAQALRFGRAVGRMLSRTMAKRSAIARANILASLPGFSPEQADSVVEQSWENLGAGIAEFVKMAGMSKEDVLSFTDLEGVERLRESHAAGKGVLIVTAHYGAWEMGAKVWPFAGFKTAVVARRAKNPWVNNLATKVRESEGVKVIVSRDAVKESVRWLKQGNLLAILIDHRVMEGGLQLPFLGRPAYTTALPAILALRFGIPVHPVHCWREGDRVKVCVDPALDLSDLTSNETDISEATIRMNAVVEGWIRKRPEAWLWIHNRWKVSN